jgi:hypothetical protein
MADIPLWWPGPSLSGSGSSAGGMVTYWRSRSLVPQTTARYWAIRTQSGNHRPAGRLDAGAHLLSGKTAAKKVQPRAAGRAVRLMDAGKRYGFGRLLLGALVVFVSLAVGDVRMMEAGIASFAVELLQFGRTLGRRPEERALTSESRSCLTSATYMGQLQQVPRRSGTLVDCCGWRGRRFLRYRFRRWHWSCRNRLF